MLGLADFLRAVRGSATMALRRAHPLAGPVLLVVLWVVALGAFFWMARDESGPAEGQAARTERDIGGITTSDAGGADRDTDDRTIPSAADADNDGVLDPTTTTIAAEVPGQERTPDGSETPTATSPPPTNRPSYDTPRPTTTTTTAPRSTTSTTAPPEDGGGLVGDLLDLLGLG